MGLNLSLKKIFVNSCVALFFITLFTLTLIDGYTASILWYSTLGICVMAGMLSINYRKIILLSLFIVFLFVTGILNDFFIGTTSIRIQFLMIILFICSFIMLNNYVSEVTALFCFFICAIIVIIKLLTVSDFDHFYSNASSNFVSVYLLYPLVVYYTLCEYKKRRIKLYPAAIFWVFSLAARGRGGIVSSTIFLVLLLLVYFKTIDIRKLLLLIVLIIFAAYLFSNFDKYFSSLNAFSFFRNRGFKSKSRIGMWSEYLLKTSSSIKYAFCGTDIHGIEIGDIFTGNPHNSFIAIHMHNGLLMFLFVLILIMMNCFFCLKYKKKIYFICLLTFMIRGFTDFMFWTTYGTPVFFFILLYPLIMDTKKTKLFRMLGFKR